MASQKISISRRVRCVFQSCTSNRENSHEISSFRIPKDPQRAELWLKVCERLDLLDKDLEKMHQYYVFTI
ncbi:hypothetical protein ABEB36_015515 [Hypothenemus hampei]|uniref:THAP-type domain-containing protein n=1 Tax=Hypothenemus hampei TaxID=57062 RepID=A0ABD1DZW2_HYPHA